LFTSLAFFVDAITSQGFLGTEGLSVQALWWPILSLAVEFPAGALAEAAADSVGHYLAKSKARTANACFCMYVMFSLLWAVLVTLCFTPSAGPLQTALDAGAGLSLGNSWAYLLWATYPLLYSMSLGVVPFLDAENRVFLSFCVQVLFSILFVSANTSLPSLGAAAGRSGPALSTYAALSLFLPHLVIAVWMLLVYGRVQVYDMPISGNCHFDKEGFWPPKLGLLRGILTDFGMNLLSRATTPLALIISNCMLSHMGSSSSVVFAARAALYYYARLSQICSSFPVGFDRGFRSILKCNLQLRLYSRVHTLITSHILWQVVVSAILCLLVFALSNLVFRPLVLHLPGSESDALFADSALFSFRIASVTPALLGLFLTSSALAHAEGKHLLFALLHLCRLLTTVTSLLLLGLISRGFDYLSLAFVFGDCAAILSGLCMTVYYVAKYRHLAKVEKANRERQDLEAQLARVEDMEDAANPQKNDFAAAAQSAEVLLDGHDQLQK